MRRNILVSSMIIGAVVAFAAAATTFAPFSDSDTENSGPLVAGDVEIDLTMSTTNPITFSTDCRSEMAPRDRCAQGISVRNTGGPNGLAVTYSIEAWADDNGVDDGLPGSSGDTLVSCFNVEFDSTANGLVADQSTTGPVTGGSGPDADTDDLDPGEAESNIIEVGLDDDNACQGERATVIGVVQAFQSGTPHD